MNQGEQRSKVPEVTLVFLACVVFLPQRTGSHAGKPDAVRS